MSFFPTYQDKELRERFDEFLERTFSHVRQQVYEDTTKGRRLRVQDLEDKVKHQGEVIEALLEHLNLEIVTWPERRVFLRKRKRHTDIVEELEKRAKK